MRCVFRIYTIVHGRHKSCLRILISVHNVKITCLCMTPEREIAAIFHPSRYTSAMIWERLSWRKMALSMKKPMTSKNLWSSSKTWSPNRSLNFVTFTQLVRSFSNYSSAEHLLCKYLNSSLTTICMKPPQIQMSTRSPTSLRISSFRTICVRFAWNCCIRVQSTDSSRWAK